MKCIVKLLVFFLFFAVCGDFTTHAQGWQDRARKEGADYLRQALGGSQQQKQKSASPKKKTQQQAKKTTPKRATESEPKIVRFATDEQIATVRQFTGSLISPAHTKTEAAQNQWNDQRMDRHEGDETLSNARLAREIAASKKWLDEQEKSGGPIREFMSSLPVRLDEELYNRARVINEYVEYIDELSNAQPDEVREADYCMRQLMYILLDFSHP